MGRPGQTRLDNDDLDMEIGAEQDEAVQLGIFREALAEILADPDHDQCRANGPMAEAACIVDGLDERDWPLAIPEQDEAVRLLAEKVLAYVHPYRVGEILALVDALATPPPAAPPRPEPLHTDRCGWKAQQDSHDLVWECSPFCPATPPPAAPPALDVERLAEAFLRVMDGGGAVDVDSMKEAIDYATSIAAEYARLSTERDQD